MLCCVLCAPKLCLKQAKADFDLHGHFTCSTSTSSAHPPTSSFAAASINQQELHKFAQLADEWWHPQGAFAALHAMNPTRCKFIRDALCQRFRYNSMSCLAWQADSQQVSTAPVVILSFCLFAALTHCNQSLSRKKPFWT